MIAPARHELSESRPRWTQISQGRRVVETLLPDRAGDEPAPPVPAWKAWLLGLWMLGTTGLYFTLLLEVWKRW